jgi:transketolase
MKATLRPLSSSPRRYAEAQAAQGTAPVQDAVHPLHELAVELRLEVLKQSKRAGVGHIGSSLSIVDLLAVLYGSVLKISSPEDPDRDRFVLSKGHAALALYAALEWRGWISRDELGTYCGDNSRLGVHPERALPGVDFSTGSLGQGLSYGVGAALGARLQGSSRRVYVLLSDAECNEGAVWEAIMFAAHHRLSNVVAIVDLNGQQALGYTADVLGMPDPAQRWRAFGWETVECSGHDLARLESVLLSTPRTSGRPTVVLASTTFGKGVDFMESRIRWHYFPMSDRQYQEAVQQVERARCAVTS